MKQVITWLLVVGVTSLKAQDTTQVSAPFTFSAYAEVYYQYDFGKPANHTRPSFVYSYNRTNEVAVNLAFLRASYSTQRVRSNLALMTGTYANANLLNERGVLKNVFEANIGMKLTPKANLWLDAGILPSHIGFESAVRKDCWTLTRSILADNSPYYEAGVRTSFKTASDKWYFALLLLNGWQRMERVDGNNTPAFGTQVMFTPTQALTINSSAYAGNEYPDSLRRWRFFHNFYTAWQISNVWGFTVGLDAGMQQHLKGSSTFDLWYGCVLLVRCSPIKNWSLTGRWEKYKDQFGVIIPVISNHYFNAQGVSLNIDYNATKKLLWCLEGKVLWTAEPAISVDNAVRMRSSAITTSLCFSLN